MRNRLLLWVLKSFCRLPENRLSALGTGNVLGAAGKAVRIVICGAKRGAVLVDRVGVTVGAACVFGVGSVVACMHSTRTMEHHADITTLLIFEFVYL